MLFRQKYKLGLIDPETAKEKPICMDTYRWMFDCCRVPGPEGLDWSVTYAKPGDTGDSGHIIVFRNNRPWKVQTTAEDGRILSIRELARSVYFFVLDVAYGAAADKFSPSSTTLTVNTLASASSLRTTETYGPRCGLIFF
jgi:hypothetical protein